MYKYLFIECRVGGFFGRTEHRDIIAENAANGWRFITAIPKSNSGNGRVDWVDLVFEKYDEE